MKTLEDFYKYAEDNLELTDWQIEQGLDYIGNHLPLPYEIVDAIRDCLDDFCADNIEEDLESLEDIYDEEEVFYRVCDAYGASHD